MYSIFLYLSQWLFRFHLSNVGLFYTKILNFTKPIDFKTNKKFSRHLSKCRCKTNVNSFGRF